MDHMENEILDAAFSGIEKTTKNAVNKWFVPAILWIGASMCMLRGYFLEIQFILAFLLIVITTIFNYRNHKSGPWITLGILIPGIVNLVFYFPFEFNFGIALFSLKFEIDFVLLILGVVHFFLNSKPIVPQLQKYIAKSPERIREEKDARISGFKQRFSSKSKKDLEDILSNKMMIPEAKKAAEELLKAKRSED